MTKLRESLRKALKNKRNRVIFSILIATYIILPIDILPDFIPVLGLFDDGALLSYAFIEIMRAKRSEKSGEEK